MNKKVFRFLFLFLTIVFIENKGMQKNNGMEIEEFTVSILRPVLKVIDENEQCQKEVRVKARQEYIKECNSSSVSCRPFCHSPSLEKNKPKASCVMRDIVKKMGENSLKKNKKKVIRKKEENAKKQREQQELNLIPLSRESRSSQATLGLPFTFCSSYYFSLTSNKRSVTGLIYKPI